MTLKSKRTGILSAVGVYTIWGFTLLASTVAQRSASPNVFLMYRFVIASLVMALPLLLGKRSLSLNKKKLPGLLLLGLAEPVVYFPCEQYGLMLTNSSFAGIMIALIPVFTMLMAALVLKERPAPLQWVFCLVSIAGIVAITLISDSQGGVIQPLGVALLCLAVVTGGAYGVICRSISDSTSTYERTFFTLLLGAVFFTVCSVIENRGDLSALYTPLSDLSFLLSALYVAVFASVIGYTLLNVALANAPIANVISFNSLVTVISVGAGVFFLREPFSMTAAAAMVVVMLGIWGVQRFDPSN